ncbi:protein ORF17 [Cyprinid herpesvirus 3]|uniref:Uncharacterized protein n=2 Tax=Cyprinid herpesvirus 3 TaxID=180230 RepID=A4FTC3_CYHV3|nr:protein ORF17 [Cyprinid herpesvirus 3]AOO32740.1 protein ORF17 [Cyprinid herpesvirus 3]AOO32897.1 protein ORF17 [Cyprinid herpesvirus 3]AOO33053.1 protein ORF17 [Cyprinid herpesvirus 3]AOO33367.1 protein ORF17 [Cyprinid herpesvirus 3]
MTEVTEVTDATVDLQLQTSTQSGDTAVDAEWMELLATEDFGDVEKVVMDFLSNPIEDWMPQQPMAQPVESAPSPSPSSSPQIIQTLQPSLTLVELQPSSLEPLQPSDTIRDPDPSPPEFRISPPVPVLKPNGGPTALAPHVQQATVKPFTHEDLMNALAPSKGTTKGRPAAANTTNAAPVKIETVQKRTHMKPGVKYDPNTVMETAEIFVNPSFYAFSQSPPQLQAFVVPNSNPRRKRLPSTSGGPTAIKRARRSRRRVEIDPAVAATVVEAIETVVKHHQTHAAAADTTDTEPTVQRSTVSIMKDDLPTTIAISDEISEAPSPAQSVASVCSSTTTSADSCEVEERPPHNRSNEEKLQRTKDEAELLAMQLDYHVRHRNRLIEQQQDHSKKIEEHKRRLYLKRQELEAQQHVQHMQLQQQLNKRTRAVVTLPKSKTGPPRPQPPQQQQERSQSQSRSPSSKTASPRQKTVESDCGDTIHAPVYIQPDIEGMPYAGQPVMIMPFPYGSLRSLLEQNPIKPPKRHEFKDIEKRAWSRTGIKRSLLALPDSHYELKLFENPAPSTLDEVFVLMVKDTMAGQIEPAYVKLLAEELNRLETNQHTYRLTQVDYWPKRPNQKGDGFCDVYHMALHMSTYETIPTELSLENCVLRNVRLNSVDFDKHLAHVTSGMCPPAAQ